MARLEIGTTSREALQAQQALNMARRPGEPRVPEDGAYTEEFANRLRDFQTRGGRQRNGQPDALTMKALALEASSEPMKYEVRYNRRLYLLSERDRNQLIARLCRALNAPTGPAGEVAAKTYAMRQFWDHHNRLNRSSPVISFLIELTATVQLGPEGRVKRCEAINAQIQAAINSRDLEAAYIALRKAEPILNSARKHFVRYRDAVDRAGGNWITALEFTKNTSFLAVGLMAGPVAASYGAGAAASGLIAGAGTAAVESIATEVGHGLAGSSQGLGTASANVLRDTLVGGAVGAFTKGKYAEKILEGVGSQIARRISAQWIRRAGQQTAVRYIGVLLKGSLTSAFEGAITDTMNTFRSRPEQLTWDKFMQNIALNLISGGVFSRLDKVLDPRATNIVANMPMNVRRDLLRGLGRKASDKDLEKLVSAVGDNVIQGAYNAAVADVLKRATGKETPQVIQQRVIEKTLDRMMIARLIAVQNARNIIR